MPCFPTYLSTICALISLLLTPLSSSSCLEHPIIQYVPHTFPLLQSFYCAPWISFSGKSKSSNCSWISVQFSSVQSLSRVWLFATPWTAASKASLTITNSRSLPKPMSIESVMPPNHLILCRPLLLLPSIFPSFMALPLLKTIFLHTTPFLPRFSSRGGLLSPSPPQHCCEVVCSPSHCRFHISPCFSHTIPTPLILRPSAQTRGATPPVAMTCRLLAVSHCFTEDVLPVASAQTPSLEMLSRTTSSQVILPPPHFSNSSPHSFPL